MTTIANAREAVYQAFNTGWGTRTAFHLEGNEFREPAPGVEWARVSVRNFAGTTETIGDPGEKKHRRNASVFVHIFTPADEGMKSAGEHAQFALDIFESKNIAVPNSSETLDFIAGDVRELPLGEDEKSRTTEVEIPFAYEHKR